MNTPPQPTHLQIHAFQGILDPPGTPPTCSAILTNQQQHNYHVQLNFKDGEQVRNLANLMKAEKKDALLKQMPTIFDLEGMTAEVAYHDLFRVSLELYVINKQYHSPKGPHRCLEDDFVEAGKFLLQQWVAYGKSEPTDFGSVDMSAGL
jgi:hypothetical protein